MEFARYFRRGLLATYTCLYFSQSGNGNVWSSGFLARSASLNNESNARTLIGKSEIAVSASQKSSQGLKPVTGETSKLNSENINCATELLGITEPNRVYRGTMIGVLHALLLASSVTRLGYVAYFKKPISAYCLPFLMVGLCTHIYFGFIQEALVGLELSGDLETLTITKGITAQKKQIIKVSDLKLIEGDIKELELQDYSFNSMVIEYRASAEQNAESGLILSQDGLKFLFDGQVTHKELLAAVLQGNSTTIRKICAPITSKRV